VCDARAVPGPPHVTAVGTLIGTRDGPCYLADLVLLSFPPQVGRGIEVRGVDLDQVPGLRRRGDRYWTEAAVLVSGRIDGEALVADRPPWPSP